MYTDIRHINVYMYMSMQSDNLKAVFFRIHKAKTHNIPLTEPALKIKILRSKIVYAKFTAMIS